MIDIFVTVNSTLQFLNFIHVKRNPFIIIRDGKGQCVYNVCTYCAFFATRVVNKGE